MERLYPDRLFSFNDTSENWEAVCEKALEEMDGVLFLIDEETGESVEAEILFMYSTLIYSGFNCKGIVDSKDRRGYRLCVYSLYC